MGKIKMALVTILSICLLTACGQTTKQSPDISNAFSEESKPQVSQNVIDVMAEYEHCIDVYCEFMDLWFTADLNTQAKCVDQYVAANEELARNQEIMQGLLDRRDEFNDTDYAYMEQTTLRCAQKLLDCANGGLQTAEEILNG